MKKTKLEKGITLIALIITIIVLLILAVVSIAAVQGSDIIGRANNAVEKHEEGKADEESKLQGYAEFIESKTPGGIGKAKIGTIVKKNSTINGEAYSSINPIIPAGFMAINVTTSGHESYWDAEGGPQVSEGLVISDGTSEFVWIPVENLSEFAVPQSEGSTDYRGVLYDWNDTTGNTTYDSTNYREPANLSTAYDNTTNISSWTENLYQESFNAMVESVVEYKGFYVGRYETSFNGTVAQSKSGETPMHRINWFSMYEKSKTYSENNTSLGVVSEMIWGCQWDAMLRFILTGNEASHIVAKTNVGHIWSDFKEYPYKTGKTNYSEVYTGNIIYNDIASNIYDLEGNVSEFTNESYIWSNGSTGTERRVRRGGSRDPFNISSHSPIVIASLEPDTTNHEFGSRLAIYVKVQTNK